MKQLKKILGSGFLIAIMAVAVFYAIGQQTEVMAEEVDEKKYTSANDIAIHTVFTFREAVEESDGFQVYKQMAGYDRQTESPTFKLEGVLDSDRAYLYEAADMTYYRGINSQHKYDQFDVDIYLHKEDMTLRHFKYTDCAVNDYKVTTLFDKEEGWTTSKGFAIIDEFEFECSGYKPNNPLYDLMKTNGYQSNTQSTSDLDSNPTTWESHPKFKR